MTARTTYGHDLRNDPTTLRTALAAAEPFPFWLADPSRPQPRAALDRHVEADLVVVGGGYCGLWTALVAKERDPDRRVVLLERARVGWAASGRNGGFAEASLTHGRVNGQTRFADELETFDRLAAENFRAFADTLQRYGIDAEWEETGVMTVATEPHQVPALQASAAYPGVTLLSPDEIAARGKSPVYRAAVFKDEGYAFVHPGKLAWGLADAAERLGVEIHENTPALGVGDREDGRLEVETPAGSVVTAQVALATNAFPSLLKRTRLFTVPIYDYALMTEPLTPEQLREIGWVGRHGITDSSREFHYYRKTSDDRILFGGYDAVYHRGRQVRSRQDQADTTFERLADHFFTTFPQLQGTTFTHKWGGAIDMSTRLVAHHGVARRGRVAYSAGYTGLGVVATRFGAETMLDLLAGESTERTGLAVARSLPVPIPPEPLAFPLIQVMRRAVARADSNHGRDGLLLKTAGRFGIGFDS